MKFGILTVRNFLSYGPAKQQIPLDDQGLVGIFGVNKDSSHASNGSGKSSLLEALGWVIWGETLRGLKGDEVVNQKEGKDCEVSLTIYDGKSDYKITRTRATEGVKKSNDLVLMAAHAPTRGFIDISAGIMSDTQALIDGIIGMDFATFTQSVMLTDKTQSFCTLTDSAQKALLEEILDIGVLSKAKKVAKERLTTAQNDRRMVQQSLQYAKTNLENTVIYLEDVKNKRATWEASQAAKKAEVNKTIKAKKAALKDIKTDKANLAASEKLFEERETQLAEDAAKIQELTSSVHVVKANTEKHRTQLKIKINEIDVTRRHIKKDCDAVSSLAGTVCANCRQQVDADIATRQLDSWNEALSAMSEQRAELDNLMQMLNAAESEDLAEISQDLLDRTAAFQEARRAQNALASQIKQLQLKVNQSSAIEASIETLKERLAELETEVDPLTHVVETVEKTLKGHEHEVADFTHQVNSYDEHIKYLEFWDKAYGNGGIKSLMISSAIDFLSDRAQKYSDIMSDGAIKITFNTQTANKDGTMRERFSVDVTNTVGGDTYKGNSSGERRRADLAVSLALADLAGTRASKPVQCLMLDEPFESLDAAGIDNVFRLLKHAEKERGTVLCITHQEALQDKFQKTVTIEKNNGFSFIRS